MVQSMRAIGPRDPDLVVNALVDYPVIWNWLLTAVEIDLKYKKMSFTFTGLLLYLEDITSIFQNLFALAFDTFLVIATFLRRERSLRVYLVTSSSQKLEQLSN